DVLGPVGSDSQSDQHAVLMEEYAVDDDHSDVERIERLAEPTREHPRAHRHEPARHRTSRHRPLGLSFGQRVQRTSVLPGRHADRDRLQPSSVERVAARGELEARKPKLLPLHRSCPQPRHLDPPPAERDFALHRPAPHRSALRIGYPLRSAQRFALAFHHRRQHLTTRGDAEREESLLHVVERREQSERKLHFDELPSSCSVPLAPISSCDTLPHGGSFLWVWRPHPFRDGEEPPFSLQRFNSRWDIPLKSGKEGKEPGMTLYTF